MQDSVYNQIRDSLPEAPSTDWIGLVATEQYGQSPEWTSYQNAYDVDQLITFGVNAVHRERVTLREKLRQLMEFEKISSSIIESVINSIEV